MATTKAFLNSKKAQMVAVMLESLFVGIFSALMVFIVWILWNSYHTMPRARKALFGSTLIMFSLSAIHLGLVMQEVTADDVPLACVRLQIILSMFQYVIGDLVLIWRVWVMWTHSYVIIAGPLVLMLTAAGDSSALTVYSHRVTWWFYPGFTLHLTALRDSSTFFTVIPVALIVANTTLCTLLIVGRIWYLHRKANNTPTYLGGTPMPPRYRGIIILIVESGALYTACQIVSLILNYTQSVGLSIVLDLEIPLIGILPTLIIIFVHLEMVPGAQSSNKIAAPTFQKTRTNRIPMDIMSLPTSNPRHILPRGFDKHKIMAPLEHPESVVKSSNRLRI